MMTKMEQYREHIEYTFNAFCKTVLYHAAINICRKLRRKQQFEVSSEHLKEIHFDPESIENPPTVFLFCGTEISIKNEQLAHALLKLPEKRREILFLSFYLGYSDIEIGKMFGRCRTTVFRRRKAALQLLRKEMEGQVMDYRKPKLLPYEVIEKTVAGEPEAVNTVLQHYTGYIKYLSYFQGRINDDIQEQLKSDLLMALFRFRFDR